MTRYPILVLAYRRTNELLAVLDSLQQLEPSIVYFHLHDAPTPEQQEEVNKVKMILATYKGPKEIKYSREPLGVRSSLYSAIKWVSEKEDQFYIFEDDVVLKPDSAKKLDKFMTKLKKERGILKFGDHQKYAVYWGWAITSDSVNRITERSILEIPYETMEPYFESKIHYSGIMELYKRGMHQAWDDEFGMLTKILGINEICTEEVLTDHIGIVSTRTDNGIDGNFGEGCHIMFKNGELIN